MTMSPRDQRVVLTLMGAAVVWRWLLAQASPMPGVDACHDLWLAGRLAQGGFVELAPRWWQASWALLVSPLVVCGMAPWTAAKILASLCGGFAVWPVASAAERLREGAGVPAAVLAMVAAGTSVAAGAASATAWHALLVAFALWAWVGGRIVPACALATLAGLGGGDRLCDDGSLLRFVRLAIGPLCLVPLAALPPRPRRLAGPALLLALVLLVTGLVASPLAWWPAWSPLVAVLVGVGLARLSTRWRDLVLCVVVAAECHGAWNSLEPLSAAAERSIARYVARRLPAGQSLVSDLPRVLWAAGRSPHAAVGADLVEAAGWPAVGALVLGRKAPWSSTVASALASRFTTYPLPSELQDLAAARGLRVLIHR